MELTSYSLLLYLVLGIFIFCYFVGTWVWIKVDKKSLEESSEDNIENYTYLYLSKNFCKKIFETKSKIADKTITITAILAPDKPFV